jgi:hypothetical protein
VLSLLIAKEVLEKVQLEFVVVGHTHEDIDNNKNLQIHD